ncbi:hypothetical protein D0810_07785 [Vibrio cholerae]|nr:hypothetical protein [Vibrio cholerae]EGQ9961072.1 hypothetical protein [Vibrio cholerae]EGQ9981923.1 hypothetical protein [Vibrio cholerae]EGR0078652.1 hypothetical protein [Vibrio cholerae]EGR0316908.1 hypothetical protein [Vibrio cholerae]
MEISPGASGQCVSRVFFSIDNNFHAKIKIPFLFEITRLFFAISASLGLANFFILKNKSVAAER